MPDREDPSDIPREVLEQVADPEPGSDGPVMLHCETRGWSSDFSTRDLARCCLRWMDRALEAEVQLLSCREALRKCAETFKRHRVEPSPDGLGYVTVSLTGLHESWDAVRACLPEVEDES